MRMSLWKQICYVVWYHVMFRYVTYGVTRNINSIKLQVNIWNWCCATSRLQRWFNFKQTPQGRFCVAFKCIVMNLWHWNVFRVIGPWNEESKVHQWFPFQRTINAELWFRCYKSGKMFNKQSLSDDLVYQDTYAKAMCVLIVNHFPVTCMTGSLWAVKYWISIRNAS